MSLLAPRETSFTLRLDSDRSGWDEDVEEEEYKGRERMEQQSHGGRAEELYSERRVGQHQGGPCHVKKEEIETRAVGRDGGHEQEGQEGNREERVHCVGLSQVP